MIFAGALGVTLLGRKRENQLLHARLTVEIEREQARESLRQQEAFAGALLEHMLEAVVACGADGQLILFNRAAREWHGLDPRNIPQEEWPDYYDLYHADGAAPMAVDDVPLVRAYRGETLRDAGMAIAAKGKPMRYVDANAAPLLDDKNQLLGAVAVMRDITETKTQQEELKRKNEELERFTYTVSHDLKGPLITIKGFSGALQQDIANGKHDRLQGDLARIGTAADKMETLLNDLLNLSRIGRFMNPPIDVDMNRLTQDLLGQLRGPISACDAEVVVQADLPPVHGDSQRIGEVLQNLVENALKFSREGIRPRIEIGARAAKREPIFFVRDHGVGIEPEYHHTIFGLFNKLDNRTEGNGIGLALVQRIIENHQGRIWVESEGRGHGTTFYFTLPAAKPKEKDQAR